MSDNDKNSLPHERRQDEALTELSKAIKSRERQAKTAPLLVVFATVAVLALIVGGIWFAATYQGSNDEDATAQSSSTSPTTTEPEVKTAAMPSGPLEPYGDSVTCEYVAGEKAAKEVSRPEGENVPATGTQSVTLSTSDGDVNITLDNSQSPCTTHSFAHLVKEKFYNDTVCHRAVKSPNMAILQCGDPSATGTGGPGYSFNDEFPTNGVKPDALNSPVTYKRGTLAMANSGENTNGSQFFLVTQDTTLPPKYNVFGTISEEGLATLDKIMDTKVKEGADGAPEPEVRIESATLNS
ncbi:peptidylprolyl isomerase [Corynebacterium sp. zg254]|uniref:Peptidyl-prolyl cis-trans isomerase n=1 Tax=Corynebacterium zhongnanshanii TaxID=2768834 RepID=A0ABQ6VGN8_9CORY|nr:MULTISPECIES: peptidylprolyl isomerase [Corynebacterium]KAB3523430.1 peptidylprolyl isomerase [Corynebacterium zhongnanshanii]MCR5913431.1 peptidylprolyl isomerase [Corynebacterium sp. zg254]